MSTWNTYRPPTPQSYGDEPSAINGITFERYRVTVEKIEESDEVIRDRLMALASKQVRKNMHLWAAWDQLGQRYGFVVPVEGPPRLPNDNDRALWAKRAADEAALKAHEDARREAKRAAARERRQQRREQP